MGISPQAYLVGFRLEKAAALLADRRCTVGEAAKSVGYEDAFVFSRMYKKRYGLPPSATLAAGALPGRKRMRSPLMRAIRPPMAKPWILETCPRFLLGTICASRSGGIQWP